jgi:UDP-N-acetylmuramate--alanine ligase
MNLESAHNIYFLGIGGIGMSSLARYFHSMGKNVAGYDLSPSAITDDLVRLGIDIHFTDDVGKIPEKFLDIESTLVVRTPAVPEKHSEYQYFLLSSFRILKRAEVLGLLFNAKKGIAVAGTHGKTTVSSMTGYIMDTSGLGCTAFLGGILKNINSNLILNASSEWVVSEADEFDRSFLRLKPLISLVTWVDADHLDIYDSADDIRFAFNQFISQTKTDGTVILKKGISLDFLRRDVRYLTYALEDNTADFYATDIRSEDDRYSFDIVTPGGTIKEVELQAIGITNIENAVAAASLAYTAGVDLACIREGLSGFMGVRRRFDIRYQSDTQLYIDDYAHHPRELDAVIGSIRRLYPERKLTGIFQPHLFSRTKDFAAEFAESLSALDELILLDIYPARELPVPGISSEIIFEHVTIENKMLCAKAELMDLLKTRKIDVLLTAGAGDIDRFIMPIKELLSGK